MSDQDVRDQTVREETVRDETPQTSPTSVTDVRDKTASDAGTDTGFLPDDRMQTLRNQWSDVQASFVDDPRQAVQKAHGLVTEIVDDLTQMFTNERSDLESQWSSGGGADTEALRVALQRYRSFFNRLLGTPGTP